MSPPTIQPGKRGQAASYGEGRVCATPDCTTQLSRYNRNDHCSLHDGSVRERTDTDGPITRSGIASKRR